jgi:hypothetical protein
MIRLPEFSGRGRENQLMNASFIALFPQTNTSLTHGSRRIHVNLIDSVFWDDMTTQNSDGD